MQTPTSLTHNEHTEKNGVDGEIGKCNNLTYASTVIYKKKLFVRSFSAVTLFLKSGSRQSAAISASGASCWHIMHRSLRVLSLSRATNPSTSGVGVDDEGRVTGDDTIVRWTCMCKETMHQQHVALSPGQPIPSFSMLRIPMLFCRHFHMWVIMQVKYVHNA